MAKEIKPSDFIQSLEKGLKVIAAFGGQQPEMTLTEVARKLDLTRANARRILLTLEHLGYMASKDDKLFFPTAKVLSLGYAYLSTLSFREIAQPHMQQLALEVNESCSMSVLEQKELVYVARVHTKRIMTIALGVGMRLPLHATSMGKVLLAALPAQDRSALLNELELTQFTPNTIVTKPQLEQVLQQVYQQGWAMADEELELGVRSIACPVRDKNGNTLAAINISGHASRVSAENMRCDFLPRLQAAVQQIENELQHLS